MKKYLIPILIGLFASACSNLNPESAMQLQAGSYRGFLMRPDGISIVFNFELQDSAARTFMIITNGAERIRVDAISQKGHHFRIRMPLFNSEFKGLSLNDGTLWGSWIRDLGDSDQVVPFRGVPDGTGRFDVSAPPAFRISGRWAVRFTDPSDKHSFPAVGLFFQHGDTLLGTFMHTDGDDRYLQGIVDGDSLKLSTFDGSHSYLFTARIANDSTLVGGRLYSGLGGYETWDGHKDDSARLPDPYSLTTLVPGKEHLDFSFPDLNHDTVSLHEYLGKVVVVQIMGSWCPNCMDETAFLSRYYDRNRKRGIAVIGLAYERTTDFSQSRVGLLEFQRRYQVHYPLLITGVTDTDPHIMEKTLPAIRHFQAFPTTLFVDKKGNIRKINTGFTGPGTGAYYLAFKKEFGQVVDSLLSEP